jgi:Fe2+ or Zn2+ uptake regulation protein
MTPEDAILDLLHQHAELPSAAGVGSLLSQQGVNTDVGTLQITLESMARRGLLVRGRRGWVRPQGDSND